jgi:hypothetical protein
LAVKRRRVPYRRSVSNVALTVVASFPTPQASELIAHVRELDDDRLSAMIDAACRHGASQSQGDPGVLDARGFEPLTGAGVRTLIATPVRGRTAEPLIDAAMLIMDELAVRPHISTVNVLELLMANAAVCTNDCRRCASFASWRILTR